MQRLLQMLSINANIMFVFYLNANSICFAQSMPLLCSLWQRQQRDPVNLGCQGWQGASHIGTLIASRGCNGVRAELLRGAALLLRWVL